MKKNVLIRVKVIQALTKKLPAAVFILAAGCRLGPTYEPPEPIVPLEWKGEEAFAPNFSRSPINWWEIFEDDLLNCLEKQALAGNFSLQETAQKVRRARALVYVAKSELYPAVGLAPSYSDTGQLFKIFTPPQGASPLGALGNVPPYRVHQFQYVLPFNLSYEVDLWGKIRSGVDSAILDAKSVEMSYLAMQLSLTADVASRYFALRTYQAEINFLEKTIESLKKASELNLERFQKGRSSYSDVAQADLILANTQAELDEVRRLKALSENALATLLGTPASLFTLEVEPLSLDLPPPSMRPNAPALLLLQRPDLQQAEFERAARHFDVKVAYASLFPSLSLTSVLGYSSPDLKNFLQWFSRLWAIGANGFQTIYDSGKKTEELEASWARFGEADRGYQQIVVTAFQEVEDSLENLEQQALRAKSFKEAYAAATKSLEIFQRRFVNGVAIYLEVTNAEQGQLNAAINYADAIGNQYQSTVQLIKAIGGSWYENN